MAKETPEQRAVVGRVMHEFKEGKLDDGHGEVVRNPKQAIAIALSEAGASNQQSPEENREHLARTRARGRAGAGAATRADLLAEAARRGIRGRSRMTKAELERAIRG